MSSATMDLFGATDLPVERRAISRRPAQTSPIKKPLVKARYKSQQLMLVNGRDRSVHLAMSLIILQSLKTTPRKIGVREAQTLLKDTHGEMVERSVLRFLEDMRRAGLLNADNHSPKGFCLTEYAKTFLGIGTQGETQ